MVSTNSIEDYIAIQLQAIFGETNVYQLGTEIIGTPTLHCVFNLTGKTPGEIDNRASKTYTLQIDAYYTSSGQNLQSLRTACDAVEELYNEQTYISTGFTLYALLTNRDDTIETLDDNIHQSQFIIELRYNEY